MIDEYSYVGTQKKSSSLGTDACNKTRWRRFDTFGDTYQQIVDSASDLAPQSLLRTINNQELFSLSYSHGSSSTGSNSSNNSNETNNENDNGVPGTPNVLLNKEISQLKTENKMKTIKIKQLSKVNLELRMQIKELHSNYQKQFENYKDKMDVQCEHFRAAYKVCFFVLILLFLSSFYCLSCCFASSFYTFLTGHGVELDRFCCNGSKKTVHKNHQSVRKNKVG